MRRKMVTVEVDDDGEVAFVTHVLVPGKREARREVLVDSRHEDSATYASALRQLALALLGE